MNRSFANVASRSRAIGVNPNIIDNSAASAGKRTRWLRHGYPRSFPEPTLITRVARHSALRSVERVGCVWATLTLLAIAPFLVANVLRTRGATSALARASAFSTKHTQRILRILDLNPVQSRHRGLATQGSHHKERIPGSHSCKTRMCEPGVHTNPIVGASAGGRGEERERDANKEARTGMEGERSRLVQSDDASSVARAALSGDAGEGARLSGETALLGRSVARQACLDGCAAGFAALVALVNSKRARKPSRSGCPERLAGSRGPNSWARLPTGTMARRDERDELTRGDESA